MKILLVGRYDGWMKTHLLQVAKGFTDAGEEVVFMDYRSQRRRPFPMSLLPESPAAGLKRQTQHLQDRIREEQPQLIIFVLAHLNFDFAEIRSSYSGQMVLWDLDGVAASYFQQDCNWTQSLDKVFSVSKYMLRQLKQKNVLNCEYLAHGVDSEYYQPQALSPTEKQRFSSALGFVGRPTERRAQFMETIAEGDLTLWGRRWVKKPYAKNQALQQCVREDIDILGQDLNKLYCANDVMVNILREPFVAHPSIMSLQVFSIPAAGVCLLTEWVEELEDAFELEKEILAFRSLEDFQEQALRYAKEPKLAQQIGACGRKRCLAEHTHKHRAEEMLSYLK